MVAERTRRAREAQKKAAEEGAAIIANQKAEEPTPQASEPSQPAAYGVEKPNLTTTQWLALGSFIVSLIGLYYKRKEIKNAFTKQAPPPTPHRGHSTRAKHRTCGKGFEKYGLNFSTCII